VNFVRFFNEIKSTVHSLKDHNSLFQHILFHFFSDCFVIFAVVILETIM